MVTDLATVIQSYVDDFQTQLFTALPAKVVSFNSEQQTVVVKPTMLEPYTDGLTSEFPEIADVPVMFPSAGGGSLTFPIKVGNEVLLVFSSRNYDTWWDTGDSETMSTTKRFNDINDAIAIVGLTSRDKSVQASTEDVELKFNGNVIRLVSDGTVEIDTKETISVNNSSEELITVLSDALQAISDITTNTAYGPAPINNKPDVLAIKARLDTFKK
jgi:hypothetical protein